MLLVESWLRHYVNPALNITELAHVLTMSGSEVESIRPVAPAFTGIVVGHILTADKHPNADKLKVCTVDIGLNEPLQIVCGASNVTVGMKAPLATIGAVLPDGTLIKQGKLRGVDSFGMLCSQKELGLFNDAHAVSAGLWVLPDSCMTGQDIRDAMNLNDTVLEIKLTPNKADCLSVWGMAREVVAITQSPLLHQPYYLNHHTNHPIKIGNNIPPISINIENEALCGRFTGRIIKNVNNTIGKTPAYIVERLERAGQRSINPLVDISNYVLLDYGQPSHVFDLNKLTLINDTLNIRYAKPNETLTLLNGQTVTLSETTGVVADNHNAQAIAGVMGGEYSAVSETTSDIILEVAFWNPNAIQGIGRHYGISSDAAHRFERGVDFEHTASYLDYLTQLILDVCGGQAGPMSEVITTLPVRNPVTLRVERCNKILGITLTINTIESLFKRLGFAYTVNIHDNTITVTPPTYRFDIAIEEDLIEEVARLYGFDNIPAQMPIARQQFSVQPEGLRNLHDLRLDLARRDYHEVINYSFVEARSEIDFANNTTPITLLNPIARTMSVMRSTQISGLVNNLKHHVSHRINRIRLFELGKVFLRNDTTPATLNTIQGYDQPYRLSGLAYGRLAPQQWGLSDKMVDFYDVKADLNALYSNLRYEPAHHIALHPGRSANIVRDNVVIGIIGELHPKLCQLYALPLAPIVFEIDAQALLSRTVPHYQAIAKTPLLERDVAVVVDIELPAHTLTDTIDAYLKTMPTLNQVIQSVIVFDVFKGGSLPSNKKSLTLRIELQDEQTTLTDADADNAVAVILDVLQTQCQAVLR